MATIGSSFSFSFWSGVIQYKPALSRVQWLFWDVDVITLIFVPNSLYVLLLVTKSRTDSAAWFIWTRYMTLLWDTPSEKLGALISPFCPRSEPVNVGGSLLPTYWQDSLFNPTHIRSLILTSSSEKTILPSPSLPSPIKSSMDSWHCRPGALNASAKSKSCSFFMISNTSPAVKEPIVSLNSGSWIELKNLKWKYLEGEDQ